MKIGDIEVPQVFVEALCVHRIFAAAGVPMEDVYVIPKNCVDPETLKLALGVMAVRRRPGEDDLTFTVTVGAPTGEFMRRWPEAVRAYQKLSQEEAVALTDRTAIRMRAAEIIAAMVLKGFRGGVL